MKPTATIAPATTGLWHLSFRSACAVTAARHVYSEIGRLLAAQRGARLGRAHLRDRRAQDWAWCCARFCGLIRSVPARMIAALVAGAAANHLESVQCSITQMRPAARYRAPGGIMLTIPWIFLVVQAGYRYRQFAGLRHFYLAPGSAHAGRSPGKIFRLGVLWICGRQHALWRDLPWLPMRS